MEKRKHTYTFFNEEWNIEDNQSQYIDGVDERPNEKKSSIVED